MKKPTPRMGDPNWHAHARMPLPPDHGAVKGWAEPGEVFYPGLRAISGSSTSIRSGSGADASGSTRRLGRCS